MRNTKRSKRSKRTSMEDILRICRKLKNEQHYEILHEFNEWMMNFPEANILEKYTHLVLRCRREGIEV